MSTVLLDRFRIEIARGCANTTLTVLRRFVFKPTEGIEHFTEHYQHAISLRRGRRTE